MSRDTRGMTVVDRVAQYTQEAQSEGQRVTWWRWERFQELGADSEQCARLCHAGTDWHAFAKLLEAGCTADLAESILG